MTNLPRIFTLFILMLFAFSHPGRAQEVQWFQPTHEWYYNVYCLSQMACGHKHYAVQGTTVIAGREGVVLSVNTLEDFGESNSEVLILHAGADTVFRYSPEAEKWHMLYDMGAQVGDVWTIQDVEYLGYGEPTEITPALFRVEVTAVETIETMGVIRRKITTLAWNDEQLFSDFHFGHNEGAILEGIGPVGAAHGLIGQVVYELLPLQNPSFQCFLEDGSLVYGSDDAPCTVLSTEGDAGPIQFSLHPNPAYDRLFVELPMERQGAWQLSIFDIHGRVVQAETGFLGGAVHVQQLPAGIYLLQATGPDGEVGVQKFVRGK